MLIREIIFSAALFFCILLSVFFIWKPIRASTQKNLGWAILISVPVLALGLYWKLGAWRELDHYWMQKQQAVLVKNALAQIKDPQQLVEQLKQFLQTHSHDAKGWHLLGNLYMHQDNYPGAVQAFAYAVKNDAEKIEYKVSYAQALFFVNDNKLTDQAQLLLKQVLLKEPNHIDAMNLLAINAYNQHQYQRALNYWEKLVAFFPPESRDAQVLYSMIAKAQKALAKHEK